MVTEDSGPERFGGFEAWYAAEHPRVLATLSVVCGDLETAREATDEAFARALLKWPRLQEMESPGGWLYTVALNLVRRHARRRSRERDLVAGGRPPPVVAEGHREVWDVVQSLPPRQRTAVTLRYLLDMKEREVAEVMKVSPGTVASTLAAARGRLAGLMAEAEGVA